MNELATTNNPFALTTLEAAEKMAGWIAESGCFGIKKPAQALTLMMLSSQEGKTLSQLLRQVHVFEDGKLSQRADYSQSAFELNHTILWHVRTSEVMAGSFFKAKPIDDEMRNRAIARFELQWELDSLQAQTERDRTREAKLMKDLSKLAREDEATVIRTLYEAEQMGITEGTKGLKNNWRNPKAMLQWRCVTDGVKLIDPSVMSGLSSEVDLQDSKVLEQTTAEQRMTPQQRERQAIEQMIAQHTEDAFAPGVSPQRKQELLGLAAELRCKLAEMEGDPVKSIVTAVNQIGTMSESALPKFDTDAGAPVVNKDDDQLPGLEASKPQEPELDWRDYRLQHVKSPSYKNKRLGELSREEIEVLWTKRAKPFLDNQDLQLRTEAQYIDHAQRNTPSGR